MGATRNTRQHLQAQALLEVVRCALGLIEAGEPEQKILNEITAMGGHVGAGLVEWLWACAGGQDDEYTIRAIGFAKGIPPADQNQDVPLSMEDRCAIAAAEHFAAGVAIVLPAIIDLYDAHSGR